MKQLLTNKEGEVRELTSEDFKAMHSMHEILPSELVDAIQKRQKGHRGKQKTPLKVSVTARYSKEVIDYFKATGTGWQSRMDSALKEWIKKHPHAA
jgi:uncharacterized protein (DUF4415 family)